ncbi:MAG: (d)CMP kinase [Gammaproteobacteria bacterium]|nr:(d)CMP kinase [Gammaproteobacteria bacterium]
MIPAVTIDGPSGSGKGTIGKILAKKLKFHYLDSGAIYRILAFAAIDQNININDDAALVKCANELKIAFINSAIKLNNIDITTKIRTEECGVMASKIARIPVVRDTLLRLQKNFRKAPGLVADGRDMGTVVFPDAKLKIFLTASAEERAKRRFLQLKEQNLSGDLPTILKEIKARDKRDAERKVAPLKPAKDAHIIDTTYMTIEEVVTKILEINEF